MSIFNRLFTMGKAETHAVLDKLEDPIKMAEQGVRELRKDLNASLESLAQVKAQAIRTKREAAREKEIAADYEQKAMMLLRKAQEGNIDMAEAERLAQESLSRKEAAVERAASLSREIENFDKMTGQVENNIQKLKQQIGKWDNELKTLKARAQVGKATRKMNQQLAKVDSTGTIAMLEKMRDKVQQEESLAEAYGEMAQVDRSIDDEISSALASGSSPSTSGSLAALKAKMGLITDQTAPAGGT